MYEYFQQQSQNATGDATELVPDEAILGQTMAIAGISKVISFVAAVILFPLDKAYAPNQNDPKDDEVKLEEVDAETDENKPELSTWEFILSKVQYDIGAWA